MPNKFTLKDYFLKPPPSLRNKSTGEYSNSFLASSQNNTWEFQFSFSIIPCNLSPQWEIKCALSGAKQPVNYINPEKEDATVNFVKRNNMFWNEEIKNSLSYSDRGLKNTYWRAAAEAAAAMLETSVLETAAVNLYPCFFPSKLPRKCIHMNSQQLKGRIPWHGNPETKGMRELSAFHRRCGVLGQLNKQSTLRQ